MCDYSLMEVNNRLAVEGENLLTHRFPTHSIGLASALELAPSVEANAGGSGRFWRNLKQFFQSKTPKPVAAVCIPPGAQLLLHDIPANIRCALDVASSEKVTFTQISAAAYRHRDAIRFANGHELLLQHLNVGQRVTVLSLGCLESAEPSELGVEKL